MTSSFLAQLSAKLLKTAKSLDRGWRLRADAERQMSVDPQAALAIYTRLCRETPGHPMHWIGAGLAYVALKRPDEAATALAEARGRTQRFPRAYLALADLEGRLGNAPEKLRIVLRELERGDPRHPVDDKVRISASVDAELLNDDVALIKLLQPLAEEKNVSSEVWTRLLHAVMRLDGEQSARTLVRNRIKGFHDYDALNGLMEVYAALGRQREARLLNRRLTQLWPRSSYHVRRYALELGRIGLGVQADRRLRQEFRRDPSKEAERDYGERAYIGGEYTEATRRLGWMAGRRPQDAGAYLAWGYALANAEGIEAAERHFGRDIDSLDNYGALVGMAHMAMRRKDRALTLSRWEAVSDAFPDDGLAVTERARAHFDSGESELALTLCRDFRSRGATSHQGVDEFYGWLLVTLNRLDEALAVAHEMHRVYGAAWTATEIMIQASGLLGRLELEIPTIVKTLPRVGRDIDVRHLYACLRLLEVFGHRAEAFAFLFPVVGGAVRLDWAWPYITPELTTLHAESASVPKWLQDKAHKDHDRLRRCVSDKVFDKRKLLKTEEVGALLKQAACLRPKVHIVNLFEQASGGSELHALDLGERLRPYADVHFWAPEFPNPLLHADRGVTPIDPSRGAVPSGGVLVFIGVYYKLGPWLKLAKPSRVLVLYNTFDAVRLSAFVRTLHEMTDRPVELLFCSDMMRAECGLPGLFEPSPIDLADFPFRDVREDGRFVIGRHSRDVPEKHNVEDAEVYRAMVKRGADVRLLGATCMGEVVPRSPMITLLPAQRGGVQEYLNGLDVFFYRTGTWIEPWGRVVIEAMALGLPVVVHERGGYAEAVESGVDGFVFRTTQEAVDQLSRLQEDMALRRRIGAAGRRKVESLIGDEALRRLVAVYLLPPADAPANAAVAGVG